MSGIACPFCQKKFQAQDLITHCRICRALQAEANSAAASTKADVQQPKKAKQPLGSEDQRSSIESAQSTGPRSQESMRRSTAQQESRYSSPTRTYVEKVPETPDLGDSSEPRIECPHCGRKFIASRLEKHVSACAKLSTRKVPSFNPHDQRWKDMSKDDRQLVNEVEPATPMNRSVVKSRTPAKNKLNWSVSDKAPSANYEKSAFNPTYDDFVPEAQPAAKSSSPQRNHQQSKDQHPTNDAVATQMTEEKRLTPITPSRPQTARNDEHTGQHMVSDPMYTSSTSESRHRHHRRHRSRHGHTPHIPSEEQDRANRRDELNYISVAPGHAPAPAYSGMAIVQPMQQVQPIQQLQQIPPYQQMGPQLSTLTIPSNVPGLPSRVIATPPDRCTFCIYCGLKFHHDAVFCGNCGSKRQTYDQLYGS